MAKSIAPLLIGAGALLLLMSGGKKSRGGGTTHPGVPEAPPPNFAHVTNLADYAAMVDSGMVQGPIVLALLTGREDDVDVLREMNVWSSKVPTVGFVVLDFPEAVLAAMQSNQTPDRQDYGVDLDGPVILGFSRTGNFSGDPFGIFTESPESRFKIRTLSRPGTSERGDDADYASGAVPRAADYARKE